ncbi:Cobyrinic acid A,C-diamide synthase [Pseudoruegeria aquimaris]|uniref:Hydrogenobyrinate a,c-diamide synthase n=1 Tax=Pseudoruegeria aquimaris TaxID=393663 RepID=A0A1Y5R7H9_9RHOB|nr:cobyrinate a,c-diamide synthase [Pseudoruegeria aquimaris]SLN10927.1 Cobyrinic acid A,C-diamide synthase [Pseudoruegeria aquimaris]
MTLAPGSGLLIAAPASGSGKTTLTLGLLRALRRRGADLRAAKSGPDYIDPRFHEAACGQPCLNLDAWAMRPESIRARAAGPLPLIVEGAMGLFDGAPPDGKGSAADLARVLGLPVIFVVDAARMSQSVAPLVAGFAAHVPDVRIAGVILNRVGSVRHETGLRRALAPLALPVLGALPRSALIRQPSRHLGLVQAEEHGDLEGFLETAADLVEAHVDLDALAACAAPLPAAAPAPFGPPPAQRIAVARDAAFAFSYPHQLADWRAAGAEISFFSPLAGEAPREAGFIYLPGGYPELHAGRIAAAQAFMAGLRAAHADGVPIYGECGGYMVMGEGLVDAQGMRHEMAGLLPLETSFAERRLHLGYRDLTPLHGDLPAPLSEPLKAHEFHYATTLKADGDALFEARDAEGAPLGPTGLRAGSACGSFAHVICPA